MASLSDKIAASANMSAFSKAKDLKSRLLFTLIVLVLYRVGTFIPLPGIDTAVLKDVFDNTQGGLVGMFDMFAGGALSRMSIMALSIFPYISASIVMQLLAAVVPSMIALKKEGATGQRKISQYTRYLTIFIAMLQGYAIAVSLEVVQGASGLSAVINPGWDFRFTAVISLLCGTMIVVWLGEQITARGIGNGSSLIIAVGIIAGLPGALAQTFELSRVGQLSSPMLLVLMVMAIALVFIVVMFERAQRRIIIQYPKAQARGRMSSESSHLPLKINPTGVMPPIFAGSLMMLPLAVIDIMKAQDSDIAIFISTYLSQGNAVYLLCYVGLIVFFTFFWTASVFNPEDMATKLKNHGGFVAGIRPGKSTADYLDYVMTRLTVLGATYLSCLCAFPEILIAKLSVPFFLGGTSLLIVVSVTLDFVSQVQSHLIAHQYEGLIRKARSKGRL